SAFPARLAWWRKRRGLSQFRLATAAACSQRHLSFLELGRTKPSREMVLRLSSALDMPLRQANELMLAAGYAPAWSEADLGADAAVDGTAQTGALLQRLMRYPGVRAAMAQAAPSAGDGPVLPMLFQKGQTELRLFTTLATLGTPRDVTLQELRVESFFPMDDQ